MFYFEKIKCSCPRMLQINVGPLLEYAMCVWSPCVTLRKSLEFNGFNVSSPRSCPVSLAWLIYMDSAFWKRAVSRYGV